VGTTSFSAKYGYDGICKELILKTRRILTDRRLPTALCLAAGIIEKLSNDLKKKNTTTVQKTIAFSGGEQGRRKKKKKLQRCLRGKDGESPLYLAAQENNVREYISGRPPARCWTLVYIIEYVVHGKRINELEAKERP
jgi:hypothetical protein